MSNPLYDAPDKVREWRKGRGRAIGSSDIAPILGLSPYRTGLEVYAEKVAALEDAERDNEPATYFDIDDPKVRGHLYEPAISRAYELRYGCVLEAPPAATHPQFPYCAASADRRIVDGNRLVELKKVSRFAVDQWGEPETDAAPEFYLLQAQWQCAVYGLPECDIFALVSDDDFRRYPVEASQSIATIVFEEAAKFWDRVMRRDPPQPDWSHSATAAVINKLRRPKPTISIVLPDELAPDIDEYLHLKATVAAGDKARKLMEQPKAKIVYAMGEAGTAKLNGHTFTRKEINVKGYEVKPRTDIRLTVKSTEGVSDE